MRQSACSATFRNLRDGRVFVKEVAANLRDGDGERSRRPHYFWLCKSCCRTMTVIVENGKRAQVVPLPATANVAPGRL